MAVIDTGTSTAGKANVDSNYNLQVRNPVVPEQAGLVGIEALMDNGANRVDSANTPYARRLLATPEGRQLVGGDIPLWQDTFNYTVANSNSYSAPATTQTVTWNATGLFLNGSAITTVNTNSALQSKRQFQLSGIGALKIETNILIPVNQTNQVIEWGCMYATLPGAAAPTDGIFFRVNASNELRGVVNFNGTETQTGTITMPTQAEYHNYKIVASEREIAFWVDDTVRAVILLQPTIPGQPQPFMANGAPFMFRYIIGGVATSLACTPRLFDVNIAHIGQTQSRDYGAYLSSQGLMGYQAPPGTTVASTANYANSANPTAAVPTNTTAALGVGLGGQFWETDTLAVTTDGVICSYQNPAGTINVPGRMLYIYGVKIDTFVQTALTGGGYNESWSLAFGHTAVSLATAEAVGTGVKAPRRVAIGARTVASGAVALTQLPTITLSLSQPVAVNPGEFVALAKKKIGTAPSAGVMAHVITFDAVFE
jgi:hypothetical protein